MNEWNCAPAAPGVQDVMIDLPGEAIQCWRSGDKVRVILRKHRDVIFDVNLAHGRVYTIESRDDFYVPTQKKLRRKAEFRDGEIFHLWVGRDFKGELQLKCDGKSIGAFKPIVLDTTQYGADPKIKPEPLLVSLGQRDRVDGLVCTVEDRFGTAGSLDLFRSQVDPKLSMLSHFGSKFDYSTSSDTAEIKEYVCVAEAQAHEIQPQVLAQLDGGVAVEDSPSRIFKPSSINHPLSDLGNALAAAATFISGNSIITSNYSRSRLDISRNTGEPLIGCLWKFESKSGSKASIGSYSRDGRSRVLLHRR